MTATERIIQRIGGLVEEGTLKRDGDGLTVRFTVTDTAARLEAAGAGRVR